MQLILLMIYAQILLTFYKPPGYWIYSLVLISCHLVFYLSQKLKKTSTELSNFLEIFVYTVYLSCAILKIALLPELGFVQDLENILGLRNGWALFISDFPRRIALITAPIVVLTISHMRVYQIVQKFSRSTYYVAGFMPLAMIVIYCCTLFTTGFPISTSINDLNTGPGTEIYLQTINIIMSK